MDSASAYFSATAKAIITKLDQNIKQIEFHTNCKICEQKVREGHVTDIKILGLPRHLLNG